MNIQNSGTIFIKNPFNELLEINIMANSNISDAYSLELYGIDRRRLKTENLNKVNNVFDTQNLSEGVYIVVIRKNGIVIKTEKLIKL